MIKRGIVAGIEVGIAIVVGNLVMAGAYHLLEKAKEKILNAYDLPEDTDTIMLKGVVSRKKQLVPTLVSVLQHLANRTFQHVLYAAQTADVKPNLLTFTKSLNVNLFHSGGQKPMPDEVGAARLCRQLFLRQVVGKILYSVIGRDWPK